MDMKSKFGLIGNKISYSFSPFIHGEYFKDRGINGEYKLFSIEENELEKNLDYFQDNSYGGLNVTIPYKGDIIKYMDLLSSEAQKIGAVNTIKFFDGKWHGYNTDYYGIIETFKRNRVKVEGEKVLVLGSGGGSKAVITALNDLGAENVVVISRKGISENEVFMDNYENIDKYNDFSILVNTTPVGTFPNMDESPLEERYVSNRKFVFDLIYNPWRTKLIQYAENNSIGSSNGLFMLVVQALRAQEIWRGDKVESDDIKKIYEITEREVIKNRNIVLIGMPGAGKSTIAKMLGNRLSREVVECDMEIEERSNRSISEIFKNGEDSFRKIEKEVVKDCSLLNNSIISTGGGVVKDEDNIFNLKHNGVTIFIDRDIDEIFKSIYGTDERPLFKDFESLKNLQKERRGLYLRAADYTVENNGDILGTIEEIEKILKGR